MGDYQLGAPDINGGVIRTIDQATIPADPGNRDWQEYQKWLEDGGVPDPYIPPPDPGPPPPTQQEQDAVLYDHENRIRAMEGQPPLTLDEFKQNARATAAG